MANQFALYIKINKRPEVRVGLLRNSRWKCANGNGIAERDGVGVEVGVGRSKITAHNPLTHRCPTATISIHFSPFGFFLVFSFFIVYFCWLFFVGEQHLHNEFICLIKSTREHEYTGRKGE